MKKGQNFMNVEEQLKAENEEARRQLNYEKSVQKLKLEEARICEALNITKKIVEGDLVWENVVGATALLETSAVDEQMKQKRRNDPSDFLIAFQDKEIRVLAGTFPEQNDLLNTITKNIKKLQDYHHKVEILITNLNCEVEDLRRNMM